MDASINILFSRNYDPNFPMLLRLHNNSHTQFNLIGYSYGSLIAAQLAIKYATKGSKIDYLVLIGSPISREFLTRLHNVANIQKIIVMDLDRQGDPIYAGISKLELAANLLNIYDQMQNATGHFYYAKEGSIGNKRRKLLADHLHQAGLR
ncbi:MAG: alpha/beta fold hydrolase [Gammaproteobacteria bacterium]|nr:alpha/beta fold hydrolase [Gammaproteobacteria bacterium]